MTVQSEYAIWQADLARKPRRPWFVALRHLLSSWRK